MKEQDLLLQWKERYYITTSASEDAVFSIPAIALASVEGMRTLLERYGPLVKALDKHVPATYFSGYFGMLGLGLQYALSVENVSPNLTLDNLTIELRHINGQYYMISYLIKQLRVEQAPAEAKDRRNWLHQAFERFYGETVRPLLEAASQAAGITIGQLWGQLPTRFDYDLRQSQARLADPAQHALLARLQSDYDELRFHVPPSVFGRTRNPLDVRIREIESLADPCKMSSMKSACCLYYRTDSGDYCYTCPKLKEAERLQRRETYRAAQLLPSP